MPEGEAMAGQHRWAGRGLGLGTGLVLGAMLVGCGMGNYSNPTLSITGADVRSNLAVLDVEVTNPSDFNLTLTSIDYTLTYGMFPVATGQYSGRLEIPSGKSASLRFPVPFDSQPIGADDEVELSGEMHFEDNSNSGNMQLESAAFTAAGRAGG